MTQSPFRSGPRPAQMDEFEQQLTSQEQPPAPQPTPQHAAAPVPQPEQDEARNPWVGNDSGPASPGLTRRPAAGEYLTDRVEPAPARQEPQPGPAMLVRERKPVPTSGMRRAIYSLTGGAVNLGPSAAQLREMQRQQRIQSPLSGAHVTTYSVIKGGTGKTSTSIGVSMTAAELRPEPVVYGDFNPDAGDGTERIVGVPGLAGVNRLADAAEAESIHSIGELSQFLHTQGRLTVLPGEPEPRAGESLSSRQFNAVIEVLSHYYSSIHVDTGTGITHPVMPGILARTDTLVVPAAYSITGARRARETLDWLRKNGYVRLADSAIVALTAKDVVSRDVNKAAVREMFADVALVTVPQDPHMADGAVVRLEQLQPATREAYAEIAALVADRYRA